MPGVQEQVRHRRAADDRRAVRRHRPQAGPEAGLRRIAAAREQIVHAHLECFATRVVQRLVEAGNLGHPADANPVIETRDRDLVGFVEHRRYRSRRRIDDRRRERVALQRINRDPDQVLEEPRRVRTERDDECIRTHRLVAAFDCADPAALHQQRIDRRVEAEPHADLFGQRREARGEQLAVAGFVAGQAQPAGQLVRGRGKRRFGARELGGHQQFIGDVRFLQHRDVFGGAIQLLLRAEHLQRAAGAAFVLNARFGAQRLQAVAAVFGQTHHARLVHRIAPGRAVAQHLPHPLQLEWRAVQTDRERRVLLEHPFDRL
ncbi:hypothetical protein LMG29542_08657 [Paraburkholderia humisilvae]|uniref:Uncharacterized protein n=1 Tax=Paraburkholderia humisilvae TaxID=627669 RepID=A0A6J5FDH7_9BURK|nr:hypothetical protein LMG29542_08657 [Paraburkholderia humisilvae]